ncbi:MAG: hypothetical protein AAF394_15815, partial [Planctomycetota bacterium]
YCASEDEKMESKESEYGPYQATAHLLPEFDETAKALMADITSQRLATTSIAVARYQSANDSYPLALDAIGAEFLAEIPKDPFNDQPLRYKTIPTGYVVYSVGPDLKDDKAISNGKEPDQKLAYDSTTYLKPKPKIPLGKLAERKPDPSGSMTDITTSTSMSYIRRAEEHSAELRRIRAEEQRKKENDF